MRFLVDDYCARRRSGEKVTRGRGEWSLCAGGSGRGGYGGGEVGGKEEGGGCGGLWGVGGGVEEGGWWGGGGQGWGGDYLEVRDGVVIDDTILADIECDYWGFGSG